MGELTKWIDQRIATTSASALVKTDRSTRALAMSCPVCYVPGVCSKTGRAILFSARYEEDEGAYVCFEIIPAEKMTGAPSTRNVYAAREVEFRCPLAIPCSCCGVCVKHVAVNPLAGSGFYCQSCGMANCMGGFRVVGGDLVVTCATCGSGGVLGSKGKRSAKGIVERLVSPTAAQSGASMRDLRGLLSGSNR